MTTSVPRLAITLTGIMIILRSLAPASASAQCASCDGDFNNDGRVTIDEIIVAVNNALIGCSKSLDIGVCDPARGPFSLAIDNPYFPLVVGRVSVYDGREGDTRIHLEVAVLDETEVIAGVTTRVVSERQSEDGELVEFARNFFVQAPDGTVCYYGEDVDEFEGGVLTGHDGQWRAGVGANRPGIFMPAHPALGVEYDQEYAPGVAQDHAKIISFGDPLTVPAGVFTNTFKSEETSPLEPGVTEVKIYAPGVGIAVDHELTLTSY